MVNVKTKIVLKTCDIANKNFYRNGNTLSLWMTNDKYNDTTNNEIINVSTNK